MTNASIAKAPMSFLWRRGRDKRSPQVGKGATAARVYAAANEAYVSGHRNVNQQ